MRRTPARDLALIVGLTALAAGVVLAPLPAASAAPTCGGRVATLVYGAGDDRVHGTPGNDVVVLGGGDDTYRPNGGIDVVCGGAGHDVVYGTDYRVRAYLGPGADFAQVWHGGWADGGPGADTLIAADTSTVRGGDGADELSSQLGSPLLVGGAGDDHLIVGLSTPRVHGGGDEDTLSVWFDQEGATVDLRAGTVDTSTFGTSRFDGIEDVIGTPQDDVIRGDSAANRLDGSAGKDLLVGRGGADRLIGGTGRDEGRGGPGRDSCDTEVRVSC